MILACVLYSIFMCFVFVLGEVSDTGSKPHRVTLPLVSALVILGLATDVGLFTFCSAVVMLLHVVVFDPLSEKEGRELWRKRTRGMRTVVLD